MTNMISKTFKAMACDWSIKCYPQSNLSKSDSESLIKQAIVKVNEFEKYYTIFKDSPFNQINSFAGIKEVQVSGECIEILNKAISYSKSTENYFNILYRSEDGFKDLEKIFINEEKSTVFLPHKEMKISLGGIGKGLAVDLAFNYLKSKGLINFIVNGSGDIRVHSHPQAPRPWKVGIKNPFNVDNNIGFIQLKNQAIATSGQYLKKNHIKSSNFKRPISVTVMADKAVDCDVWATYLSTLEIDNAVKKADELNIYSILVSETGKVFHTKKSLQSLTRNTL